MEKDVLTREQILMATEETLRRFGVAKTSVTDVAKVLQVSHGTIYRHFKSKVELLEGVTAKWLEEKIIHPLSAVCKDPSLQGVKHIRTYIQTLIEQKHYYAREDAEMFEMYAKVTAESTDLIARHLEQIFTQLTEIILRNGNLSEEPAKLARAVFHATSRFHHPAHAYEWKSPTIHSEFTDVWELLEQGLLQKSTTQGKEGK